MNEDQMGGIPEIDLEEEARVSASAAAQDEEQEPVEQLPKPDYDGLLQALVAFANQWGITSTITLNLGGSMVSGELISVNSYIDEFAAQYRDGFTDPELGKTFFELVSSFKPETPNPAGTLPEQRPRYIHMRNVRTYAPGRPQFAVNSTLWRGRISEVSGFVLGVPSVPN
jgi:hypothetical protein